MRFHKCTDFMKKKKKTINDKTLNDVWPLQNWMNDYFFSGELSELVHFRSSRLEFYCENVFKVGLVFSPPAALELRKTNTKQPPSTFAVPDIIGSNIQLNYSLHHRIRFERLAKITQPKTCRTENWNSAHYLTQFWYPLISKVDFRKPEYHQVI